MSEKKTGAVWSFGMGAIDDKKGLWIRVDTRDAFNPVCEAFRSFEELGLYPKEEE